MNLRKQIAKDIDVQNLFNKQIEDMITKGILKEVDGGYPKRYVPLIAVTDLSRESTKVRVCLDAKTKYRDMSLNDALLPKCRTY